MTVDAPPTHPVTARHGVWLAVVGVQRCTDAAVLVAFTVLLAASMTPATLGLALAAVTLPGTVMHVVGGFIADRYDTRTVLTTALAAELVVALAAAGAVLFGHADVWALVVAMCLLGGINAVSDMASATLPVQLVDDVSLPRLLGIGQSVSRVAVIVGAPLGSFALSGWGISARGFALILLAHCVGVVGTLGAVRLVLRLALPKAADTEGLASSFLGGFRTLATDREARSLGSMLLAANAWVTPVMTAGLALAVLAAGMAPAWVGIGQAVVSCCAVAGTVGATRWSDGGRRRAGLLLVCQCAALPLVAAGSLPPFLLGCAVVGVSAGAASLHLSHLLMSSLPKNRIGRVTAVLRTSDVATTAASTAVFGAVAGAVGVFGACAAFGAAGALWFGRFARR